MKPPKKTKSAYGATSLRIVKKEPNRTAMALKRIGVTAEQLAAAPQITPLLKRAEGGLDQVLTAMRFAPDEMIGAFLEKYDAIPETDRERLPIEAIALAAGINPSHLLGSIIVWLCCINWRRRSWPLPMLQIRQQHRTAC
jgi:hypothetical protein